MVAIEQASLDLIDDDKLLPGSLPEGRKLTSGNHLFENPWQGSLPTDTKAKRPGTGK
ncbi:MAG: hypothetical protein U5N58_07875 [Actinomycetota bacterium]|nr:hypothetical protein [Actinomycetota bacterium]